MENRTERVSLAVSPMERKMLREGAHRERLSVSAFLRTTALARVLEMAEEEKRKEHDG